MPQHPGEERVLAVVDEPPLLAGGAGEDVRVQGQEADRVKEVEPTNGELSFENIVKHTL